MANLILHIPHASLRIPDYDHYLLPKEAVDAEILRTGAARIVDCHSCPDPPLRCSQYQGDAQFDFNIGTDDFHTPPPWVEASMAFFEDRGFRLGIDEPYAGSIVPMKQYQKDARVKSIMLEINRTLYLDDTYGRGPRFHEIQGIVADFLSRVRKA